MTENGNPNDALPKTEGTNRGNILDMSPLALTLYNEDRADDPTVDAMGRLSAMKNAVSGYVSMLAAGGILTKANVELMQRVDIALKATPPIVTAKAQYLGRDTQGIISKLSWGSGSDQSTDCLLANQDAERSHMQALLCDRVATLRVRPVLAELKRKAMEVGLVALRIPIGAQEAEARMAARAARDLGTTAEAIIIERNRRQA